MVLSRFFILIAVVCSSTAYTSVVCSDDIIVKKHPFDVAIKRDTSLISVHKNLPDLMCVVDGVGVSECIYIKDMVSPFSNTEVISNIISGDLASAGFDAGKNVSLVCDSGPVSLSYNLDRGLSRAAPRQKSGSFLQNIRDMFFASEPNTQSKALAFTDSVDSFSAACSDAMSDFSVAGDASRDRQERINDFKQSMDETVDFICGEKDRWDGISPVAKGEGSKVDSLNGILDSIQKVIDIASSLSSQSNLGETNSAKVVGVPDVYVYDSTTAAGDVEMVTVIYTNADGERVNYGQAKVTKDNPFDANEKSSESSGYCVKDGELCSASETKVAKAIADAALKENKKTTKQPVSEPEDVDNGRAEGDAGADESDPSSCGVDDCVDSCESYKSWWRGIQERCDLSGWQEYYCQNLIDKFNGCPDSALIYPNPETGYTCGVYNAVNANSCDSMRGIMICVEGDCYCGRNRDGLDAIPERQDICSDPRAMCRPDMDY